MQNDDYKVGADETRGNLWEDETLQLEVSKQDDGNGNLENEKHEALAEDASSVHSTQVLLHVQEVNHIFLVLLIKRIRIRNIVLHVLNGRTSEEHRIQIAINLFITLEHPEYLIVLRLRRIDVERVEC